MFQTCMNDFITYGYVQKQNNTHMHICMCVFMHVSGAQIDTQGHEIVWRSGGMCGTKM